MESVIDNAAKYGLNDAQILQLGAVMLDAATETTATFLQHFIQCMVVHPEVQRQAQADIDSVIGQSRAPTLDDMQGLPYVRALIQEVFRFRSLGPVGLPHSTTTDVTIDGFFIPKNTTIFMNIWGISHNEEFYENAEAFDPSRFMSSTFGTRPGVDVSDFRLDLDFGAGRRICPGQHLATTSIYLNVMNILWAFTLQYSKDSSTGEDIPININELDMTFVLMPRKYTCSIVPRSTSKVDMVKAQFLEVKETFARFE